MNVEALVTQRFHFPIAAGTFKVPRRASKVEDFCIATPNRVYTFLTSRKGAIHLVQDDYVYRSNLRRSGRNKDIIYWECVHNRSNKCRGRVKSIGDLLYISNSNSMAKVEDL